MKLITKQIKIDEAVKCWDYCYKNGTKDSYGRIEAEKIHNLSNPTATEINEIIGNNSWTELICNECNEDVDNIMELGEELDEDTRTVWICKDCLMQALSESK